MSPDARPTLEELVRYSEGETTRSEAERIEAQLADSAEARERLARLRATTAALGEDDEALQGVDLVADVRQAIDSDAAVSRQRRWKLPAALGGALALAATASLVLWLAPPAVDSGFRAKRGAGVGEVADRWVGIEAFRKVEGAPPERLSGRMHPDDALLFAYTNLGAEPRQHLMILAVDARGAVHWYHPAYLSEAEDPVSVAIRGAAERVELREAVRHELPTGPLAIYGLFTEAPLQVSRVEAVIEGMISRGEWSAFAPTRLPIEGAGQQRLQLWVRR